MRRLPSLRGLQAFEAVARVGTLAAAADALGITPSAVSHRLRGLEEELGVQLLHRLPKGMELTDAGRKYRTSVSEAFAGLVRGTEDLVGPDQSQPLTVSLTSEIGMRWLMPRFHRFRLKHPDIDTAILSTYRVVDLQAGEVDLALRYGAGQWPGVEAEPILKFAVSPVCSPAIARKIADLSPADALASQPLINADYNDWEPWLAAAGIDGFKPSGRLRFLDYTMAMAAAVDGQGILLGYSGYVETEIAAGLLTRPFDLEVKTGKGYYLVYVKERLADPRIRAFRDWVAAETEAFNEMAARAAQAASD
ncbi:MAG TPA: LysR substrate-binding domain-containing protein [Afifellaceae bacterium]|nr:LysR substrate-binding domain-containing protein [Afifellaceae bacterium]